jgi:hypothetical protein
MSERDSFDDWLKAQAEKLPVPDAKIYWQQTVRELPVAKGGYFITWSIPALVVTVGLTVLGLNTHFSGQAKPHFTPRNPVAHTNLNAATTPLEDKPLLTHIWQSHLNPKQASAPSGTASGSLLNPHPVDPKLATSTAIVLPPQMPAGVHPTPITAADKPHHSASKVALSSLLPSDLEAEVVPKGAVQVPNVGQSDLPAQKNPLNPEEKTVRNEANSSTEGRAVGDPAMVQTGTSQQAVAETPAPDDIRELIEVLKDLSKKPRWQSYLVTGVLGSNGPDVLFGGNEIGAGFQYQPTPKWAINFQLGFGFLNGIGQRPEKRVIEYDFGRLESVRTLEIDRVVMLPITFGLERRLGSRHLLGIQVQGAPVLAARGGFFSSATADLETPEWGFETYLRTVGMRYGLSHGFQWNSRWQQETVLAISPGGWYANGDRLWMIQIGLRRWL